MDKRGRSVTTMRLRLATGDHERLDYVDRTVFGVNRTVFWQDLPEYSSDNLALQDDPYTPSTHISLEIPRNGGINGYFTFEHGLVQREPFIITLKWG
jgi:hypothetical protein